MDKILRLFLLLFHKLNAAIVMAKVNGFNVVCVGNSSNSFMLITLKLNRFRSCYELCISYGYNPQIIFCYFFTSSTYAFLRPKRINSRYFELVIPQLHLPRASYDLFVYDFRYNFSGIVGGSKLRCMCLHSLRSPFDFFRRQNGQSLKRHWGDCAEIAQSSCSHRVIFTTSTQKSHNTRAMSLRVSYENL